MKKKQTWFIYGLIGGIFMVAFNYIMYHFHLEEIKGVGLIPYIPFAAGLILSAIKFSKANNAHVTFGNLFSSCFKATIVGTLLMILYIVICIYTIPEMKVKYMEIARESMIKNPQMTDEIIEKSMAMMDKGYAFMMIFFTGLYTLLAGLLFSLIGAAVAKKTAVPEGVESF